MFPNIFAAILGLGFGMGVKIVSKLPPKCKVGFCSSLSSSPDSGSVAPSLSVKYNKT